MFKIIILSQIGADIYKKTNFRNTTFVPPSLVNWRAVHCLGFLARWRLTSHALYYKTPYQLFHHTVHFFKKYKNIFIFYLNCRRIWIDVVNNDWLIFNSNVILHKIDLIQIQMNWTISNRTRRQLKNCHKYQALVKCHFEIIIEKWKKSSHYRIWFQCLS